MPAIKTGFPLGERALKGLIETHPLTGPTSLAAYSPLLHCVAFIVSVRRTNFPGVSALADALFLVLFSLLVMSELLYDCPNCTRQTSVSYSLVGQNVICPHCEQEFHATPPAAAPEEKLPFFKFSRRKMLKGELDRLTGDGEYDEADHDALIERASKLGLHEDEINKLRMAAVQEAFKPIKDRIAETAQVTDEDMECLREIGRKYHVTIADEPLFKTCREIFLMEEKNEFPLEAISCDDLMRDAGEHVYYAIQTEWGQLRSRTKGYGGVSMSIPTGIKGVRFRLGQLTPIRSEELTALARGMLYVTSKRLVFNGDRRNTTVTYRRMLGASVFRDAIEIEKNTGRSDYFFMDAIRARYVSAIIRQLKQ
jgi:hypothetical protein